MDAVYEFFSECGRKPAILSLIPKYSDAYMPEASLPEFPQPLQLLYQSEYMDLQYHEVLRVCEFTEKIITVDMAQAAEKATKTQIDRSSASSIELAVSQPQGWKLRATQMHSILQRHS